MNLQTIIGLEIHVQLKTKSKMFCSCPAETEGAGPNSFVCPICLGHPGTLPKINKEAVKFSHKVCLAFSCKINKLTRFDRKNYFYPDLPKGYQISQYDLPIGKDGELIIFIDGQEKKIGIQRVHLEEDTGKLLHPEGADYSLVDYNRAGIPLLEIVTEPEIGSPCEAKKFMQELQLSMKYLGVSDADMEKGHLRCDANISLRPEGEEKLYPKTEIKNLNSFRALEKALAYEIERQTELWKQKNPLQVQSTRGWDENKEITIEQRIKEELSDYRYFPEPDLPPLNFNQKYLEKIKLEEIPELPFQKRRRLKGEYNFSLPDIEILINDKDLVDYIEKVISELRAWLLSLGEIEGTEEEIWEKSRGKIAKLVSAWTINRLKTLLNKKGIKMERCLVTPENMAELMTIIYQHKINSATAQAVLERMVDKGGDPSNIIAEGGLSQISEGDELINIVDEVIKSNPKQVEEYRGGKINVIQFLIGRVIKETKGKANPQVVRELLEKKL